MEDSKPKLSRKEVREALIDIHDVLHEIKKVKRKKSKQKPLRPKSSDTIRELIDYIRVCIKDIMLDRDASKRERDYYKKVCKDNNLE